MPELPSPEHMLEQASPEVLAGQLFMPAAFINDTEEEIRKLEALIRDYHIGGLCFFHSRASAATNFEGKKEIPHNPDSLGTLKSLIDRYNRAAAYPLLIAMDAEWGLAMRIENGEAYPYALCLGALSADDPLLYETGLRMAADCLAAGVHWNLAPVADVNHNPANPVIGYRSFGADPHAVATRATSVYRGMRDGGLLGCAKHFPGHGDTAVDSHLSLPVLRKNPEELRQTEFPPFQALIDAGIDAMMTGHLAVPSLDPAGTPASLSGPIIREWLRGELGFTGAVASDALNMHAVSREYGSPSEVAFRAFEAGNDLLCFPGEVPEAHARICRESSKKRIREAFRQVWKLKERALAPAPGRRSPSYTPSELRERLGANSLSLIFERESPREAFSSGPFSLLLAGTGLGEFARGISSGPECQVDTLALDSPVTGDSILPKNRNVLIALAPPSLKPPNRFGISREALDALKNVLENRNAWICLFGNPYVLDLLDTRQARGVLVAYQDLPEFQRQAAGYYMGKAGAPGKLPVPLKNLKL